MERKPPPRHPVSCVHQGNTCKGSYASLVLAFSILLAIVLPTQAADGRTIKAHPDIQKRVALVMGNETYPGAPLMNPANDASDLAAALRKLGFDVTEQINVTQKEMNRAIAQFGEKLNANTVALFFFAGHGIQVKGKNYLLPIDAQIAHESSVRAETVDVDTVLDQFSVSPLSMVILDACRNNPFERKLRSKGGGLAQIDAPKGTLIAYATSPGKVAPDGTGRNSIYTAELLKAINEQGLNVEGVFKRVRANVTLSTGDAQTPWEASSLVGDFYFKGGAQFASIATAQIESNLASAELAYWDSVKDSPNSGDLTGYLNLYPNGKFADLARNRLKTTEATSLSPLASVSSPIVVSSEWRGARLKIGFVNSQRILNETPDALAAKKQIERDFSARDQELQRMAKQGEDEHFKNRQKEFKDDLSARQKKEMATIFEKVNLVIKQIAEAQGYDIIFQEAVYADPRIDITDSVLHNLK
jgi:Skp family chaperone for outer membrane proteins